FPSADVQADPQQRQPPQENGENGRAYGLKQAEVQVPPGPRNDHADNQVNEKDNADRSFQHRRSAPVHWWMSPRCTPNSPGNRQVNTETQRPAGPRPQSCWNTGMKR